MPSEGEQMMMSLWRDVMPQVLKSMVLGPYTEEAARQIASATVLFYNELIKNGFSKTFAERLTEVYLGAFRMPAGGPQLSYRG